MKLPSIQFSIRQFLAFTLVFAIVCAGIALWKRRGNEQKLLVEKLRAQDIAVGYKLDTSGLVGKVAESIGTDMVAAPKELFANSPQDQPVPMDDLLAMKFTEHLAFNLTGVTDNDLDRLRELPNLKYLNLSSTQISDAGISNLTDLKLISLHIERLTITDNCVEPLSRIKSLKWISVTKGTFSTAAIDSLQEALPECTIHLAN